MIVAPACEQSVLGFASQGTWTFVQFLPAAASERDGRQAKGSSSSRTERSFRA